MSFHRPFGKDNVPRLRIAVSKPRFMGVAVGSKAGYSRPLLLPHPEGSTRRQWRLVAAKARQGAHQGR